MSVVVRQMVPLAGADQTGGFVSESRERERERERRHLFTNTLLVTFLLRILEILFRIYEIFTS